MLAPLTPATQAAVVSILQPLAMTETDAQRIPATEAEAVSILPWPTALFVLMESAAMANVKPARPLYVVVRTAIAHQVLCRIM